LKIFWKRQKNYR